MCRITIAWVVCLGFMSVARAQAPAYTVESKETKKITATMTYDVSCPSLQATEWLIFVAQAPELPGQTAVKTTTSINSQLQKDLSPQARNLLLAVLPVRNASQQTDFSLTTTYSATLRSRQLKPLAPGVKGEPALALTKTERTIYTAELGDIDYSHPDFKRWCAEQKLIIGKQESEIDFARRAFLAIRKDFKYEYKAEMVRKASSVCISGKSDCGGLSVLFVSVLRANKIPARLLYGRWAKSAETGAKLGDVSYYQWHVKSEFYAEGTGWVPADISGGVEWDKTEDARDTFGKCNGDFLTFHIDPNLVVTAGTFGKQPIHNLQLPSWWAKGKGTTMGYKIKENWEVK